MCFLSFWWSPLYAFSLILVMIFVLLVLGDITSFFTGKNFKSQRVLPEKFSNSDENPVEISLENKYAFLVHLEIIDELPLQFQKRDFLLKHKILPKQKRKVFYYLKPFERGEYFFGKLNIYFSTNLGLVRRRYSFQYRQMVKVYPSFIQINTYVFLVIDIRLNLINAKK